MDLLLFEGTMGFVIHVDYVDYVNRQLYTMGAGLYSLLERYYTADFSMTYYSSQGGLGFESSSNF